MRARVMAPSVTRAKPSMRETGGTSGSRWLRSMTMGRSSCRLRMAEVVPPQITLRPGKARASSAISRSRFRSTGAPVSTSTSRGSR